MAREALERTEVREHRSGIFNTEIEQKMQFRKRSNWEITGTYSMITVQHRLEVNHSASDMYALVNDVEAYPSFLPWCTESRILETEETHVCARLTIASHGFSRSFTTRNHLEPNRITIQLVEGPLKHLTGNWVFTPLGDEKSEINLILNFEFSNKLVQLALSPILNHISEKLIAAFEQRADQLHNLATQGCKINP